MSSRRISQNLNPEQRYWSFLHTVTHTGMVWFLSHERLVLMLEDGRNRVFPLWGAQEDVRVPREVLKDFAVRPLKLHTLLELPSSLRPLNRSAWI